MSFEGGDDLYERKVMHRIREVFKWNVGKWNGEMDIAVKCVGRLSGKLRWNETRCRN